MIVIRCARAAVMTIFRARVFIIVGFAGALSWYSAIGLAADSPSPAGTTPLPATDPCGESSLKVPDGADDATKSAYEKLAQTCAAAHIQGASNLVISTKFAPLNAALKDFAVDNKTGKVTSPEVAAHSGRMLGLIVMANAGAEIGRNLKSTIPSWCGKSSGRCTILPLTPQDLESRVKLVGIANAFDRLSSALRSDSLAVTRIASGVSKAKVPSGTKLPPGGGGAPALGVAELILESGASAIAGAMKTDSTLASIALDYSNDAILAGIGSIQPIGGYLILPEASAVSASVAGKNIIRDAYTALNVELAKAKAVSASSLPGTSGLKTLDAQVTEVDKVLSAYTKMDGTSPSPIDSLILEADKLLPDALQSDGLVLVIRSMEFGVHGGTNDSRWRTTKLVYVSDLVVQYTLMTQSGIALSGTAIASTGHLSCYPNERCGDQMEISVRSLGEIQSEDPSHH